MNGQIMIVDDNLGLLKTMDRILSLKGYEVLTASSGQDAITIAKAHENIKIVFMDIKMPLMNGVETHRAIKKIIPKAIVFMMTAYAVEELIHEALKDGAYGILNKPLELDNTLKVIDKALHTASGALVMVVDDDLGVANSLRLILEGKGFSVEVASDGTAAIDLARKTQFDIIFIDMKLPTINGLETYLSIKDIRPDVVAIMITAHPSDYMNLLHEAMQNDAYSCLQKPLDMTQLISVIDEILSKTEE